VSLTLLLVTLAFGVVLAACGGEETPPSTQPPSGTPPPAGPSPAPSQPGGTPQPPAGTPATPITCQTPALTPQPLAETIVILACGIGLHGECINQTPAEGYNEGSGDEPPLNPYYTWALGVGYKVWPYEATGKKYTMAQDMSNDI
jgi:hypothetical protein